MLENFNMKNAKPVSTPLIGHFAMSKSSCSSTEEGKKEMEAIPYSSVVGILMYTMACKRPDIAHAVVLQADSLLIQQVFIKKW